MPTIWRHLYQRCIGPLSTKFRVAKAEPVDCKMRAWHKFNRNGADMLQDQAWEFHLPQLDGKGLTLSSRARNLDMILDLKLN